MADFDPQAFLAKTAPAVAAQAASPKIPVSETFLNRAVGAIPLGNLLTNALGALVERDKGTRARLTPQAKRELENMGETVVEAPDSSLLDTYRAVRDARNQRTAEGSAQNPNAAGLGTGTGIGLTMLAPLPKTSVGATRGLNGAVSMSRAARVGNAALTGGAYGALSGATDGDADLTQGDVGGTLRDAAEGGLYGTLLGGAAGVGAELARPLAGALRRLAVRQGKQTIQGGSDIAAATREPLSDEAVEEVLGAGAIRPFSTTQATAQRIENLTRESGEEYARIVATLEARGVQGPDAEAIASELLTRGGQLQTRTLNKALPAEFLENAELISQHGESLQRATGSRRLGLTQAEDFKRSLQEKVRYGKLEETPVNAVRREVASVVRQANEDAVEAAGQAAGAGSEVRALADRFVPVKQRTGRLLEAERFAQKGSSKAEQRSPVSFKDLLVGSMTNEPLSGLALTAGSSIARNRLPSTLASGAYGLSEGLRTGSAASGVAAALAGGAELAADETRRRADAATINPDTDPLVAALIRSLRTKKSPPKKDK